MAAGSKSILLWLALLAVVIFFISSETVIAGELAENSNAQLEQHSAEAFGEEKIPKWPFRPIKPIRPIRPIRPIKAPKCPPGYKFCCKNNRCTCCKQ